MNEKLMGRARWIWCIAFIVGAVCMPNAQRGAEESPRPEKFLGTWSGTWDGAGSGGGFELTLQRVKDALLGTDAPLTGKVAVTGEPEYTATLKALTFDGRKMKARYDFPADEAAEVLLAATFGETKATGTWTLRAKADQAEIASGSWTVTRK
jgi:hypothetical protein